MISQPHTAPSVAIVGAGPGGLSAAVILAARGCRVTVFESRSEIGGRTGRETLDTEQGSFAIDRGPTFFLMPYVLDEVFRVAGKRMADEVEMTRLDPMYRLVLGRSEQPDSPITLDATQDIAEMARRVGEIAPADGKAFPEFIEANRYKLRHSESILRNPMRSPLDLFGKQTLTDTLKVAPILRPHMTVQDLLNKYFKHPQIQRAVGFQSKYLGMSPRDCPSLFTILPFIEYEYGVWHPKGGCHAIMQALARVAGECGADIRTSTPVEQITFRGSSSKATGVVVDGEQHEFDHVVVNADATWALKTLVPDAVRAQAGKEYATETIDTKRYSCSTFMLYLAVDGELDLPHHTIYVSADYDNNLKDITLNHKLTEDCSFYVCNASTTDPTMAPPGKSSVYVLVPTPNMRAPEGTTELDWQASLDQLRDRTYAQMSRILGLSDLRSRVIAERVYTPQDWAAHNINHGATFNLAHNLKQMLHWRPQNRLKGFDNLWLVGGGTHPGSGLPTIFLSAQITSRMLCDEAGVKTNAPATEAAMV
ncbi:MAG: phytoene desaturase family protein [Planctomycetota bacterium]